MFDFLNDINAPILIYDTDTADYVFIGKNLLSKINLSDLLTFKEKHCHKKSIFANLIEMKKNNTYAENQPYYFFAPNHLGETLYFKIHLTSPLYQEHSLLVFMFEDCTEIQSLRTQLENAKITQAMIFTMINSIYTEKNIALLPPHLIASLGIALNVSTILIYEITPNASTKHTYIWQNENIMPSDFAENITSHDRKFLYEKFINERSFIIEKPEQTTAENKRRMELAKIKSLAVYPIYINNKPNFVIILQDFISYRHWQQESETMEIVTMILSNVLSKKNKLLQTQRREAQFKSILDSLPHMC